MISSAKTIELHFAVRRFKKVPAQSMVLLGNRGLIETILKESVMLNSDCITRKMKYVKMLSELKHKLFRARVLRVLGLLFRKFI